jgi:hypothetical protein
LAATNALNPKEFSVGSKGDNPSHNSKSTPPGTSDFAEIGEMAVTSPHNLIKNRNNMGIEMPRDLVEITASKGYFRGCQASSSSVE